MTSFPDFFKNLSGWRKRTLTAEPLEIKPGVWHVQFRNGPTAKVQQHSLYRHDDVRGWVLCGAFRALHGGRKGMYEARVWTGSHGGLTYRVYTANSYNAADIIDTMIKFGKDFL